MSDEKVVPIKDDPNLEIPSKPGDFRYVVKQNDDGGFEFFIQFYYEDPESDCTIAEVSLHLLPDTNVLEVMKIAPRFVTAYVKMFINNITNGSIPLVPSDDFTSPPPGTKH